MKMDHTLRKDPNSSKPDCRVAACRHNDLFVFPPLSLPQLFICQYHIWLAADTKGILVLIPGNPLINIMVSTFIFVCVAHEISLITNDLAQVVIPKDGVALLKRLGGVGLFSLAALLLTKGNQPTPGA